MQAESDMKKGWFCRQWFIHDPCWIFCSDEENTTQSPQVAVGAATSVDIVVKSNRNHKPEPSVSQGLTVNGNILVWGLFQYKYQELLKYQ